MIKVGSDFSGVGAFEQSLIMLGIDHKTIYACDMDKYARQTYIANHGEPDYFPENVYDRIIPKKPLDIYMTSPPCQAFSLAGKRKGEDDKRGVLFYNSHEFITKNKPRFFIFENVKGLLSDNEGKTFKGWLDLLGGKSINGNPVIFPHNKSVPYHIYFKVLNAKDYGIPQNRERVFIVGIRDDKDNNFKWPKKQHLKKRLKDVLDDEVDEKYYLSEKMIKGLTNKNTQDNGFTFKPKSEKDIGNCVTARCFKMGADDNYIQVSKEARTKEAKAKRRETGTNDFRDKKIEFREQDYMNTIPTQLTNDHYIKIETQQSQAVVCELRKDEGIRYFKDNICGTIRTIDSSGDKHIIEYKNLLNTDKSITFNGNKENERNTIKILSALQQEIGAKEIETWGLRILEVIREQEILQSKLYERGVQGETKEATIGTINKVQQKESRRHNANVIMRSLPKEEWQRCSPHRRKSIKQLIRQLNESLSKLPSKDTQAKINMQSRKMQDEIKRTWLLREALSKIQEVWKPINGKTQPVQQNYKIRRLTPREVFRLMGFPDTFKLPCSDSQTYKQAGNSIVVHNLAAIIGKLPL